MVHKNHLKSCALEFPLPLLNRRGASVEKKNQSLKLNTLSGQILTLHIQVMKVHNPANSIWQVVQFDTDVSQQ